MTTKQTKIAKRKMKQNKIPHRTCVGCRTKKPKTELIRVVRKPSGEVDVDVSGKASGRGLYFCPDKNCFLEGEKREALTRGLEVNLTEEQLKQVERDFSDVVEEDNDVK